MRVLHIMLLLCLVVASSASAFQAAESPSPVDKELEVKPAEVEAQPVEPPTPAEPPAVPASELPTYDELTNGNGAAASEPDGDLLGQSIDINKINLDLLYEIGRADLPEAQTRMSLEECVQFALENNQDIIVTSFGPVLAKGDIMSARGAFDPVLSGRTTYSETLNQASSQIVTFGGISEIESFNTDYLAQLTGKLHWGTQYTASLAIAREESTFNTFVEEFSSTLTLTVSQPLLRGRGRAFNLATVRIAKNTEQIAQEQVKVAVMNAVAQTIKSYWDLVGASEQIRVRQKSFDNAEELMNINQRRLEIGTAAAIEVLQAKAGVASRKSDVVTAATQLASASDNLKRILNLQENGLLSRKRLVPINRPDPDVMSWDETFRQWDEQESVDRALALRPEMRIAQLDIESSRIDSKRAANQMLPQFDVSVSFSQGGRDHKLRSTLEGIQERRDNGLVVSAQGSVPIGNRAARGQYYRSKESTYQAEQQLERTKQDLVLNVRLALRNLQSSRVLVESNRQSKALQEANLAAENKRLKLGATTSFQLLQVEEDLTLAELAEVQAQINFEKALVDLRLAEGNLLEELGVSYETPEPEKPVSYIRSVLPVPVE